MSIELTWDLFIVVFFAIIIAYSFIVGKNQVLKIIISSYIAILAADGIGNLINQYLIGQSPLIKIFTNTGQINALVVMKIIIFVTAIVLFSTKGAFEVGIPRIRSIFMNLFLTSTYAIFSAGLIISTILIYISGVSIVEGSFDITSNSLIGIYEKSYLVRNMIKHYNWWFALPALILGISSLVFRDTATE